jgi:sugar lactone lactonase YvrE
MPWRSGRFATHAAPTVAEGWSLQRLTPPSLLFGANGLRTGADGRIYVAQAMGSQISAVDVATGAIETICPVGGAIVGPDDLAFGPDGALYATELSNARVGVQERDGRTRVLRADLPAVNGITFHQGRLFVDESRHGGRVMELDLDGGPPRVLVEGVPMANALEVGPDGKLYYPVMETSEIWRVELDGAGGPERVAGGLGVPDAVKFDSKGRIISTQVATGEVLRIDPRTGAREVLVAMEPGLDNLTFVGERLFVSHLRGTLTEILEGGETRTLLPGGLTGPLGLAATEDGRLYVADGTYLHVLEPGGGLRTASMVFSPGFPGFVRGLAAAGLGELAVTTSNGAVARYRPGENVWELLAEGLDQLYGVAVAPGGAFVTAELGAGRVLSVTSGQVESLATGLDRPKGVAIAPDGTCFVSESGAGRVVKLAGGGVETVLDGLKTPQGLAVLRGRLYVADADAKTIVEHDLQTGVPRTVAWDLPVGAPPGVTPKPSLGLAPFSGPLGPFADLAAGPDGALYLSADGDGSVLALRPSGPQAS